MKDNLIEILMNFFEQSLTQIKEAPENLPQEALDTIKTKRLKDIADFDFTSQNTDPRHHLAQRIFTEEERFRLTKASYQFLMRMTLWGVIDTAVFEQVMSQFVFSDSRIITLGETKWAIRNVLADKMSPSQLAFLDLVLYQKEDNVVLQ